MSSLLEEARKIPIPVRQKLADDIYDSIVEESETVELSDQQMAELERRIEHYKLHPNEYSTWDEVKGRLLNRK